MEMTGQQNVPLSQEEAWRALNDPDVLAACIPGCESLEQVGDDEFKARVRTSVGPVNAQFKGRVKLSDIHEPESYKMSFKGDGNAGFVQGNSDVRLAPAQSGQGTTISYDADAKVGGKLAQIGSRLIDGAARKMADDFFANLTTHMGGTPQPKEPAAAATAEQAPASRGFLASFLAAIKRAFARLLGRRPDS
jgi:carbon monoxide dehydrogenase subunit G